MLRTVFNFLAGHLVFLLMVSVGLQVTLRDVDDLRRRPGLYLRAIAIIELAVPLLAMAVVALFRPSPLAGSALLLLAVCPGVALLIYSAKKKGGSLVTALNLLLVVSLLSVLTVPAWLSVLARIYDRPVLVSSAQVFRTVVPTILLPLALGMIAHALAPKIAPMLGRIANAAFIVALLVVALALLVKAGPALRQLNVRTLLTVLVLVTGSALLGHAAGGPRAEDRITVGLAAVLGNPALALAVVKVNLPDSPALTVVAAYVLLRAVALLPYLRWASRYKRTTERPGRLPPGAVTP
jgi:bile acid:Na+ symporter, BASS family